MEIVLGALLAFFAAAAGAFFGAYVRKRGENQAMNENFSAIREQLRTTTRDTEEIKHQLSGHAWISQRQWSAREQYYCKLLTHLHEFRFALDELSDYYIEPGTEHMPDSERGDQFKKLRIDAQTAYVETQKLLGSAAIFLATPTVEALEHLFIEHWGLANFDAICTADYVSGAKQLANGAYEKVLGEAKSQLAIVTA